MSGFPGDAGHVVVALVNAQVLLKGCETQGYVILSAAKAEIIQRIHRPVWKDRTLVSKTTWTGALDCMQYYATVNAGENDDSVNENIMWLSVDNIQEKESTEISEPSEVPNMVGSGVSVGAVVSDTVGPSSSSQVSFEFFLLVVMWLEGGSVARSRICFLIFRQFFQKFSFSVRSFFFHEIFDLFRSSLTVT